MATKAQKTKVGLFLLASLALMVGAVAIVSGYTTEPTTHYWIKFDESVLGLGIGSLVEYLGVPVGSVTDIYVSPDSVARVQIEVSDEQVTLRQGVQAQLVMYSMVTGTMAVSLSGGTPGGPVLTPGSEIPAEGSLISNFTQEFEQILNQVSDTLSLLQSVFKGMKEGQLTELITEIQTLVTEGQDFMTSAQDSVQDVSNSANRALGEYSELAEDLQWVAEDMGKVVEQAEEFLELANSKVEPLDLGKMQAELSDVLENINSLTKTVETTLGDLSGAADSLVYDADNIEYSVRESLESLNETLHSINTLAEELQENPTAIIRGRGQPREQNP